MTLDRICPYHEAMIILLYLLLDEKLIPIVALDITYEVEHCPKLSQLALDNYLLSHETNHQHPWSAGHLNIRSLAITNLSFLASHLTPELVHIRSLHLRMPGHVIQSSEDVSKFRAFLFQCHNLQDLDLKGVVDLFDEPLLVAIGKNLLYLRIEEVKTLPIVETCLSPKIVAQNCPRLQRLGIDVGHSQSWKDWVSSRSGYLMFRVLTKRI